MTHLHLCLANFVASSGITACLPCTPPPTKYSQMTALCFNFIFLINQILSTKPSNSFSFFRIKRFRFTSPACGSPTSTHRASLPVFSVGVLSSYSPFLLAVSPTQQEDSHWKPPAVPLHWKNCSRDSPGSSPHFLPVFAQSHYLKRAYPDHRI